MTDVLVIGAGPAGLMAAETAAAGGQAVLVVDGMPSVGRKFLMAGKTGLNITKAEPRAPYLAAFGPLPAWFQAVLADFGPAEVMAWAEALGQPLFTGSTGRVFPKAMKASPLLRAWLARLGGQGVTLRTRWRWLGWHAGALVFDTPRGRATLAPKAVVLALGGGSWARLGSDGAWQAYLPDITTPFLPANMGIGMDWSPYMAPHFGAPVKSVALRAGDLATRGECVISARGLEGGGIYALSRALRGGDPLVIDLMPGTSLEALRRLLARPRGKTSLTTHLRRILRLDPAKMALLAECARPFPADLAPVIKALVVTHTGPHPLDEAISTAGGVLLQAVDPDLMLRSRPGVFCAGEMLDWEAPTGGYLITASLATGRRAGAAAAAFAKAAGPEPAAWPQS